MVASHKLVGKVSEMGLLIRMVLYLIGGILAGYGFAEFDNASGVLTVDMNQLAKIIGGLVTFTGTFAAGRMGARLRGWRT